MSPVPEKPKKVLKVSEAPLPLLHAEQIQKDKTKFEQLQKVNALFEEYNLQAENEKKMRPKPPREEFL